MKETNEDILNKLKETDSKAYESALLILKEYKEKGYSSTYNDLIYKDYKEIPVTINEFINNKNYLGTGLLDKEGKQTVFPYWIKTLNKVFPDNINTAYNTILLTGAIGLGKSFFAVVCILYLLYRMMCLKDVRLHYGLQEIDVVTFSFINITMDAAKGVAWSKCQELLKSSPWFISRGIISKGLEPEWEPDPSYKISLIYGSLPRHIIGKCIFASFEDEISFQPNQDIDIQKEKAMQLISSADARMQSRFMKGEKLPTLHILASSKRTEQSFLETYIDLKKRNNSQTTLIVDEPQWVIRTDKDSPNKFYVAVGNKFLTNEVLPLNITEAELQQYRDRGYSLLQVPMGYREKFLDDIDIALTDIAGISTSNTTRYISGARWAECRDEKLKNPFTKEILEIGNGVNDVSQYYDYFDITQIPKELISKPLFIHLDMSISGDKTGIAGVWIIGKRPTKENETQSKELFYQLAFSVAIKAPKGHQVSFEKNRQFIYWLKEKGFAIKGISSDTFQSADLGQILTSKGYNYSTISVDRVGADHLCLPYQSLKSVIYEKRIKTYKTTLLTDEIVQLERNNNGRINHPMSGTVGCFTGDTKVRLVDGRSLSLTDLVKEYEVGKQNFVYSFNEHTQRIEPKPIKKAWCTLRNQLLVAITLDNGETIKCTPNHKFMLRNGEYCEAQSLLPNDSLMPLYTKYPNNTPMEKYRLYYEPMEDGWHFEHRQFAVDVDDEKYLVHHKDFNPSNNNPTNLIWVSKKRHYEIHKQANNGANSAEARAKKSKSLNNYYANNKNSNTFINRNKKISKTLKARVPLSLREEKEKRSLAYKTKCLNAQAKRLKHIKDIEETFNVNYNQLTTSQKNSLGVKLSRLQNPNIQKRISKAISDNHKLGKYVKAKEALLAHDKKIKGKKRDTAIIQKAINTKRSRVYITSPETSLKQSINTSRRRWYNNGVTCLYLDKDANVPAGFKPGRIKTWINHSVVKVEFLNERADVYDIEVADNHNFALDAGVFVHNSKDTADALCGSLWNASQHAEEYAFDYGESLNQMLDINSNKDVLDRKQVELDFNEMLKNMGSNMFADVDKPDDIDKDKLKNNNDYFDIY